MKDNGPSMVVCSNLGTDGRRVVMVGVLNSEDLPAVICDVAFFSVWGRRMSVIVRNEYSLEMRNMVLLDPRRT